MGRRKKKTTFQIEEGGTEAQVRNIDEPTGGEGGAEEETADLSYLVDENNVQATSDPLLGNVEEEAVSEEEPPKEPETSKEETGPVNWEERYRNLESKIGEQGRELGMYRKFFDEHVQRQMMSQTQPPQPQQAGDLESEEDLMEKLLENPAEVLNTYGQRIAQTVLQQVAQQQMMAQAVQELERQHPDRAEIVQKPEFREWAEANIPRDLLVQGEVNPSVAGHILTLYKQSQAAGQMKAVMADEIATKRKIANQAAAPTTSAKGGDRKVYRRIDIMNMMLNEPEKYAAMEGEIMRAYAEGRVK